MNIPINNIPRTRTSIDPTFPSQSFNRPQLNRNFAPRIKRIPPRGVWGRTKQEKEGGWGGGGQKINFPWRDTGYKRVSPRSRKPRRRRVRLLLDARRSTWWWVNCRPLRIPPDRGFVSPPPSPPPRLDRKTTVVGVIKNLAGQTAASPDPMHRIGRARSTTTTNNDFPWRGEGERRRRRRRRVRN